MKKVLFIVIAIISICAIPGMAVTQDAPATFIDLIQGNYIELFPEMAKEEYRDDWRAAVSPIVGEENTDATIDMMLSMCMAETYGAEAIEMYAADPNSMRFNCYFLGGVEVMTIEGNTISGVDENGEEVFKYTYKQLDLEGENGFIFYQADSKEAGQFAYFAFSPDTMEETFHLEYRYSDDLNDLMSWFEGDYAYWNVGAISENYTEEQILGAINLFATENLASEE